MPFQTMVVSGHQNCLVNNILLFSAGMTWVLLNYDRIILYLFNYNYWIRTVVFVFLVYSFFSRFTHWFIFFSPSLPGMGGVCAWLCPACAQLCRAWRREQRGRPFRLSLPFIHCWRWKCPLRVSELCPSQRLLCRESDRGEMI